MAETYTQEEMEAAYKNSLGIWEGRDMRFIENIRGERRTPVNKLLRTIGLVAFTVVALSRLQFVKGRQFSGQDWNDIYYIGFRK